MNKEITNLSLRKDIKKRAIDAVNIGKFAGINSLSALVEFALEKLLTEKVSVDSEVDSPEMRQAQEAYAKLETKKEA